MQTKGSVIKEYVRAMEEDGVLGMVAEKIAARSASVLRDVPIATGWVEHHVLEDLLAAYASACGEDRVKPLARRVSIRTAGYARPLIQGTLRVFGATPETLFARMNVLASTAARGAEYRYQPLTPRSGTLELRSVGRPRPSRAMTLAMAAGLEAVMDLCGFPNGVAHAPEIDERDGTVISRYRVQW